ncbi:glycoside hydrolase family 32 protein [Aspergillus thermomutatus]|uniref:beta-fructofuranosidase n=1 Tax=Aspergillus thermomutatus TaxID=41047 RepID=A0A397G141_ASPTH|nr:uncharacterized protein CDV56_100652 [Aspergillus thermomutatus]RHZ43789.1 hypothetical protein CDV56_100652 [Aspergillus thermomutatus]
MQRQFSNPSRPSAAQILLSLSAVLLPVVSGTPLTKHTKCDRSQYPGPSNPSFETGTLDGWEVLSGTAFGNNSVSSATSYWDGPFNQVGKSFLWGFAQAGDPAVGQLRSSSFKASSFLSFLLGGGYDPVNLYVGLVRDRDGALLLNQTGTNDEALVRITWDTSEWAGQRVHMLVYDNSTASSWGHINLDDVRTGCDALTDSNGLTFHVLGQANQPVANGQPECSLYAADSFRPQFHYTPYQGWINDPAGLIQWNGQHHLFSQFNPAAPLWGPMHWSHAYSDDAVHWKGLPVALYPPNPNSSADSSGRFTGSAVRDDGDQGSLRLIFTDFTDTSLHPGAIPEVVSTAASADGIRFPLSSKNPIIARPPAGSSSGFRDPKVFWDTTDQSWKLVVGSGDSVSGKVQLYRSSDLLSWTYVGVLIEGDGTTGTMWECPNFFPIGDRWALFYGGNGLGWYAIGTYNGTSFTSEKTGLLDAGPDSYAAQWYLDESGRNLAITWMGNWPTSKWPSRVNGWAGQQSITRELFLRSDGGLGQRPIRELDTLSENGKAVTFKNKRVGSTWTVGSLKTVRLQLDVDLATTTASSFSITAFSSSAEEVTITYSVAERTLTLDTTNAGYGQSGTWQATLAVPDDNQLSLDIFIDRSSLEIFAGDGTVMTATIWPRYQESTNIKLTGHSGQVSLESIQLTPLSSSWC